jgi:predicted nucleic acid-binding protein
MSLVLDSSMSLTWCLPGQANLTSLAVLDRVRERGAQVPFIWRVEMANILGLKLRDGNITQEDVAQSVRLLDLLRITSDGLQPATMQELLSSVEKYGLTAYDASYLDLASRKGLPLATFDKAMIASAKRNGVSLIEGQ